MKKDLYSELGVAKDADAAAIKRAHRRRAAESHPDKKGGSHDEFLAVQLAYEVLSDEARRKRYDETGSTKEPRGDEAVAKAAALIVQLAGSIDEVHEDIIEHARAQIRSEVNSVSSAIERQRSKAEKYKRAAARLKPKDQEAANPFSAALEAAAHELEMLANKNAENLKGAEKLIGLLEGFEYKVDAREQFKSDFDILTSAGLREFLSRADY